MNNFVTLLSSAALAVVVLVEVSPGACRRVALARRRRPFLSGAVNYSNLALDE